MTERSTAAVPARIHLAGNPSDGYGGAVLSTVVPQLVATVRARRADRVTVTGPARSWASVEELRRHGAHHGHEDGNRLVTAALVSLDDELGPGTARAPLAIEWSTSIPRSVGLGGSSAIVLATIRAALGCWDADLPPRAQAQAALAAETAHLGIAAGIADRSVQAWGTTVLTDCRDGLAIRPIDGLEPMGVRLLWSEAAAEPSGRYHAQLRARIDGGDGSAREVMDRLAALADDAADALRAGDRDAFAAAVDASLTARCALGPVPGSAMAPVAALRASGSAVNFAGSGGALVVVGGSEQTPAGWHSLPLAIRTDEADAPGGTTAGFDDVPR